MPFLSALSANGLVGIFSFQQGWFGSHAVERIASGTCDGGGFHWRSSLQKMMGKSEPLVGKEKEPFLC